MHLSTFLVASINLDSFLITTCGGLGGKTKPSLSCWICKGYEGEEHWDGFWREIKGYHGGDVSLSNPSSGWFSD